MEHKLKVLGTYRDLHVAPPWAESLMHSSYVRSVYRTGKFGGQIHEYDTFVCMKCSTRHTIEEFEHGMHLKCSCGLHLLTYGNNLKIWEE